MNSAGNPSLFRCNVDGTSCAHIDISAGQPGNAGVFPSIMIDAAGGKLLVVTTNFSASQKPSLFRCNIDGTACTHADISAGQGTYSGYQPAAVLDAEDRTLFVVAAAPTDGKPRLFRCNADGTGCTHTELSNGGDLYAQSPTAVVDPASGKLLVVVSNGLASSNLVLFSLRLF